MKNIIKRIVSTFVAIGLIATVFNHQQLIKTHSAGTGAISFGSVDVTLTELEENDYKVTIPISFDSNWNLVEILAYLQNGLLLYRGPGLNSSEYFHTVISSSSVNTINPSGQIGKLIVVVPNTAEVGDKFIVHGSVTKPNGEKLYWCDDSSLISQYITSVSDAVITIKADPLTGNGDFSPGFRGEGTSSSPYLISSADDLVHLSDLINDPSTNPLCRNAYYKQTTDIDMSGIDFNPIGRFYDSDNVSVTENAVFSGNYDGDKHKIINLKVKSYAKYCGLFGRIGESGTTDNECKIHHLAVYGDISSSNSSVGGIVGEVGYGASIVNCCFHGSISGTDYVGGIAGSIYEGGNIKWCYYNGTISSDKSCAGVVDSVTIGNTSRSQNVLVDSCYATGELNGATSYGILNEYNNHSSSTSTISLTNNFYLNTIAEKGIPDELSGCTKLSSTALKACADMLADEYSSDLDLINEGYPVFEWELSPYPFNGSGTISDPYQIATKEDLFALQRMVSIYSEYRKAYYIQTNDIDLENDSFIPIGGHENTGRGTGYFSGYYNGNQHIIKGLNVNWKYTVSNGLFAIIGNGGYVKDLVVYGDINGSYPCGGIAGEMVGSSCIENCAFIGDVTSTSRAGGIVGCVGLSGNINNIEIRNCYHNGTVTGSIYASGILGSSCFATESSKIEIYNSYHANGKVISDSAENSFGITAMDKVWLNRQFGSDMDSRSPSIYVSNCYVTTGLASNVICSGAKSDNTTALIQSQMKLIAPDLGTPFVQNSDSTLNDGYPVFTWQIESNIDGDVNDDGEFNIADLVIFQKWLLAVPNTELANWKAADLCEDDKLDVFDLVLMRKALINQ